MGNFTIKGPGGAAIAAADARPFVQSAATELPPVFAVSAAAPAQKAEHEPQQDRLSRQIVIDRAAAEIVYLVTDKESKVVVAQFPDETRLRARAYLRALDLAKQDHITRFQDRKV